MTVAVEEPEGTMAEELVEGEMLGGAYSVDDEECVSSVVRLGMVLVVVNGTVVAGLDRVAFCETWEDGEIPIDDVKPSELVSESVPDPDPSRVYDPVSAVEALVTELPERLEVPEAVVEPSLSVAV